MASTADKITDTRNAARPNSARVTSGRSAGGATLACDNLSGWPTASKVHFVTYKIDSNSDVVAGTQLDCYGIVSGNNIGSFNVVDGSDTGHAVGDVVETLPTAAWGQDLADALTAEHNRNGSHSSVILDKLWPVGSVYINASNSSNPATLLGFGTWTAFGAGRVPIGVGTSDQAFAAAATGGESTHVLTTAELATHAHSHKHAFQGQSTSTRFVTPDVNNGTAAGTGGATWGALTMDADGTTAGSGTAHNNLPPYIVVYMWRRDS